MNLLKPNIYQKDIFSINYNDLKKKNIKNLLFDIDNTIVAGNLKTLDNKTIDLFNKLKEENFNIYIITNALKRRAIIFSKILDVKTYHFSMKPSPRSYNKIIKENNLNIKETAAIGDQIYTDVLGANKLGILSILVDPVSKHEFIITKINRVKERKLIKKTKIITKGEYYE